MAIDGNLRDGNLECEGLDDGSLSSDKGDILDAYQSVWR